MLGRAGMKGCLQWMVAGVAVTAGVLLKINYDFNGLDNAFYELLPHMPAEIFAAIGSVATRVMTCEGRPMMTLARSVGLAQPALDCFDNGTFPVAAATVKGGSILSARLLLNMALRCGKCVGYGFRPNGNWPPPYETIPTYDSDSMLAIAFVDGWQDYALSQVKSKEEIKCVVTTRNPFSRLVSMYMYFEAAGEFALRNISAHLTAMPDVQDRVAWMWNNIGRETMERTHAYLVESRDFGCQPVRFEAFSETFEENALKVFTSWGVKKAAALELVQYSKFLDMSSRTEEELKRDHHHTSSKFPPGYKKSVQDAFRSMEQTMRVVRQQQLDFGWAVNE